MYLLSKLSKPAMQFVSTTTSAGGNRSKTFSIALAYVISRQLSLPAERVDDLNVYYRLQHAQVVTTKLDDINDTMPFDTRLCRQVIESFYANRYRAFVPPVIPLAVRNDRGLIDFFGLSTVFSDEVLDIINKDAEKLTHYVNGLTLVLTEVSEKNKEEMDRYTSSQDEADKSHVA